MTKKDLIKKITSKKEFSKLPKKDVEMIFKKFDNKNYSDDEKVKMSRDILRKVFSGFASRKILNIRERNEEWILKKHLSTRERFGNYREIYSRILKGISSKNITIFDLGGGVNGFSYRYFFEIGFNADYFCVEGVGQLVDLMNNYFKKNELRARALHQSLFEIDKIKNIIVKSERPRVVFLFKVIDSLELIEKNYSKKLISEITEITDRVVLSFAERSMMKRKKFRASRKWVISFIEGNYLIMDDFVLNGERYIVFCKG